MRATDPSTCGSYLPALQDLVLVLVVAALLIPVGVGTSASVLADSRFGGVHSSPPVGPYDPLIGAPGLGVPRFSVTTAQLAAPQGPDYINGGAEWLAYDSADKSFWIAVAPSSVDAVPASATNTISATVPVGAQPFGVAVDNLTDTVYVTNTGSNNVSVVSGITYQLIGSVGVGVEPMGIALDPADHELFVANKGSDNVSVISTSSLSVVATVAVGFSPIGVAYDPATKRIFVADHGSYDVRGISVATNGVVSTTTVGIGPYGIAVDNRTDNLYVTNEGSSNVSVINASAGSLVASIPVLTLYGADLQGIAYDGRTGQVWVGAGLWYLVILNASSESIAFIYGTDPAGVTYDADTGMMCFTNTYNSTFQCMSQVSPLAKTVYVTFNESGLPAGTAWNVASFDGPGKETTSNQIVVDVCSWSMCPWGGYRFVIRASAGYVASQPEPVLDVSKGSTTVNVSFTAGPAEYMLWFNETGLAPGVGWNVRVNGSLVESTVFTMGLLEPRGRYNFTPGIVPDYAGNPQFGAAVIGNAPTTVPITFSRFAWPVYFVESGLPAGTSWFLNMTSSPPGFPPPVSGAVTTNTALLRLANGSYTYTVWTGARSVVTPGASNLIEEGGNPSFVQVTFTPVKYRVSLVELGLPVGTRWSVTFNGSPLTSRTSEVNVSEPSGAYSYTVGHVNGFASAPSSGNISVSDQTPPPIQVTFTSTWTFAVTFHEIGLPTGTGWSVAIGGQFASSLTSNVTLIELNGSYGYVVEEVPGFTTTHSGVVTVEGSNVTTNVPFQQSAAATGSSTFEAIPAYYWWVVAALASGLVALAFVVAYQRLPPPRRTPNSQ